MEQIFQNISMVIFAVIGFGILVFVHELGHFLCAKFFGIQVEIFALGWGPKLWGFKRGETTYQISWFPIGGFCKFKGDEIADDEDTKLDPDSFYGAAPYKRLLVAFCGPLTNFIVAIIFLTILGMGTFTEKYLPNRIVLRDDIVTGLPMSPAKKAGLKTGDRIVKIGKKNTSSFDKLSRYMFMTIGKKEVDITVIRENKELDLKVSPDWDKEQMKPILGVYYYMDFLKVQLPEEKNSFYTSLGLLEGDIITGIDDNSQVYSALINGTLQKEQKLIKKRKEEDPSYIHTKISTLHIKREGKPVLIPVDYEALFNSTDANKPWYIIFYPMEREVTGKNIFSAIAGGFIESYEITVISAIGLYALMFKPKKNVSKQLGGPIRIGYVIGAVTVQGFKENFYSGLRNFLSIISYISLALAFFNLLPFPAVDGGHIILNIIEIITRKSISLKIIQIINMIGFFILITLAFIIAFVDISNLVNGGP